MTVNYMKYKYGKRNKKRCLNISKKKKKTHKAEGSFKVLNMDTIWN